MVNGRLIGVGVGPGDPDLLTVRALKAIQAADYVVAPTLAEDAAGRAEAIVRDAIGEIEIRRAVFKMDRGEQGPDPDSRAMILDWLSSGKRVAFITLGDPNCYSTFWSVVDILKQDISELEIETVPGIMAFQALASASNRRLVEGAGRLSVITALDGAADLAAALSDDEAAVVVYKGGRRMPQIAQVLHEAGRLDEAIFGELLGLPGERVGRVSEHQYHPATYLATVIVPPRPTRVDSRASQ